jgi:hypothetical protein
LIYGCGVNFVIVCMRSYELDVDRTELISNGHNQPIPVSMNIEDDAVVPDKARTPIAILYLLRRCPRGLPCLVIPCLQGLLGIGA